MSMRTTKKKKSADVREDEDGCKNRVMIEEGRRGEEEGRRAEEEKRRDEKGEADEKGPRTNGRERKKEQTKEGKQKQHHREEE